MLKLEKAKRRQYFAIERALKSYNNCHDSRKKCVRANRILNLLSEVEDLNYRPRKRWIRWEDHAYLLKQALDYRCSKAACWLLKRGAKWDEEGDCDILLSFAYRIKKYFFMKELIKCGVDVVGTTVKGHLLFKNFMSCDYDKYFLLILEGASMQGCFQLYLAIQGRGRTTCRFLLMGGASVEYKWINNFYGLVYKLRRHNLYSTSQEYIYRNIKQIDPMLYNCMSSKTQLFYKACQESNLDRAVDLLESGANIYRACLPVSRYISVCRADHIEDQHLKDILIERGMRTFLPEEDDILKEKSLENLLNFISSESNLMYAKQLALNNVFKIIKRKAAEDGQSLPVGLNSRMQDSVRDLCVHIRFSCLFFYDSFFIELSNFLLKHNFFDKDGVSALDALKKYSSRSFFEEWLIHIFRLKNTISISSIIDRISIFLKNKLKDQEGRTFIEMFYDKSRPFFYSANDQLVQAVSWIVLDSLICEYQIQEIPYYASFWSGQLRDLTPRVCISFYRSIAFETERRQLVKALRHILIIHRIIRAILPFELINEIVRFTGFSEFEQAVQELDIEEEEEQE